MPSKVLPPDARPAAPWAAKHADDDYGQPAEPGWRSIDWSKELRQMEIGGRTVNYVDRGEGDGPPIVFVHGLSGQWQNWLENIPFFSERRRVVALDLPGFGLSEMPREDVSMPGYGRTVHELVERLELGKVALVGNSMGGFVSAEAAIQFPDMVDRLVLVSAAGITSSDLKDTPVASVGRIVGALLTYTAARSRKIAARPLSRHMALALVARHPSRLRPDVVYEGLMKGTGKPAFDDALRSIVDYDFRERLPDIAAPTLIVWGKDDMVIPSKDAGEFERAIPNSRKVVFDDTGHVSMMERPAAFNRVVLEFLEGEAVGKPTEGSSEEAAAA